MKWLTKQIEFEDLPLYLRIPDYQNIWIFQEKYSEIICITHEFESTKDNGLPTSEYNKTLFDFDQEVSRIGDENKIGIIFLIETYGGGRNYWFFGENSEDFLKLFKELKCKHSDKKLDIDYYNDSDWNFIKDYPFQLYK